MKNTDLVITPGDPEGIGPEVTLKALGRLLPELRGQSVVLFGSAKPYGKKLQKLRGISLQLIEPPLRSSPGWQAGWAVETAARFVLSAPRSRALVTGPVSKERLQKAGFPYQGHTDFLAALTRAPEVSMMLANETFRVVLVTNHIPLSEVPSRITPERLGIAVRNAVRFCAGDLGIARPKIAILALNPHAGESGLMGLEESRVLEPFLRRVRKRYPEVGFTGPHPADSFFALEAARPPRLRHSAVVALYHDQGLIPLKLSGFSESMNMTLGLPIIRTSVDHGTAFDIAGKNRADPGSMIYAIRMALKILKTRRKYESQHLS
jgi:4-hydroxythreonine-4-phosphate dehydrogenase